MGGGSALGGGQPSISVGGEGVVGLRVWFVASPWEVGFARCSDVAHRVEDVRICGIHNGLFRLPWTLV